MEHNNLNNFPELTTERLHLRQLSESDVQEIFLLRSDTLINRYLARKPCKTVADAMEFIQNIKKNSVFYWAIEQKGNQKLIGTICIFDISKTIKKGEIGFELLAAYQRKGIMREAAEKIIEYCLQVLELKTIDAYTHRDNESSINILKRLNFSNMNSFDADSNLILFRLNTGYKMTKN